MNEKQENKKKEWCDHCVFDQDCDEMDDFLQSDEKECDWFA